MRRSGFTLIELIFVIVIIGILAAVAIPKFKHLKQAAEANAFVNNIINGAQSAAGAAVNFRDIENDNTFKLEDILTLKGKGWKYDSATGPDGNYTYTDLRNNSVVGWIALDRGNNEIKYAIDCSKFDDPDTQAKCEEDINSTTAISETLHY